MPIIKARSSSIINNVDLRGQPTAPTADHSTNTNQLASTAFVRTAIAELIDSSPDLLNTLNELAQAINSDPNFATTVATSIATKLPKDGSEAMTGELILSGAPTNALGAVTKQYVDDLVDSQMIYSTDDVPEGTTHLYYTEGRVRSAVSLYSDNISVLSYDYTSGQFTYNHPTSDGILEGTTNLYFTQSRVRNSISLNSDDGQILSYSAQSGELTFTTPNTDKIVEGQTNKYFTTSRARDSVSGGANIDYDNSTGIISTQAAVWSVNSQTHDVVLDTDDINEGSANLYFTNARAAGAVSLTTDNSNILSYNTGTGRFTWVTPNTDAIAEGSVNLYFTNQRVHDAVSASGDISYNSSTGNFSYSTPTTDGVNEGSTNLYYTDSRARNSVSLSSNKTSVLSYDNTTGLFTFNLANQTTDDVAEGSLNLYFTTARARQSISATGWTNLSYNDTTGVINITAPSTSDVTEGTNLYYTDARVRNAVSATHSSGDGDLTYDNTTGVFDYVGPTATDYRQAVSANHVSGHGDLQYSSSTGVFSYTGPTNTNYRNAISATKASGDGDIAYDSATGTITYTGPSASETRAHFSAIHDPANGTSLGDDFTYDSSTGTFTYSSPLISELRTIVSATTASGVTYDYTTGIFSLANIPNTSLTNSSITIAGHTVSLGGSTSLSTNDVNESEQNLYFTDARARNAISLNSDNTSVLSYNSTTGEFTFNLGNQTTDDVAEGSMNLYFTTQRARDSVSAIDAGGDGSFSYDSTTGAFTYTGPNDSEVRAHFSATSASGVTYNSSTGVFSLANIPNSSLTNSSVTVNGATVSLGGNTSFGTDSVTEETNLYYTQGRFDTAFSNKTTTDLTEGTNLYYTQARFDSAFADKTTDNLDEGSTNKYFTQTRARASISGGTGVTYTGSTGVIAIGQDVSTTSNVTFGDVTVSGDLTVNGTMTAVNSTTVTIADKNITLAQGSANAAQANGAGLTVDGAGATITYASGTDSWNLNKDVNITGGLSITGNLSASMFYGDLTGNVTGQVSDISNHTTTELAEGTNLYFTDSRARSAVSLTSDKTSVLSYDSASGVFTFALANASTSDIAEGSNQYFTQARARSSISVTDNGGDGSLSYNSSTGVIEYTGPSASETRAHFSATSSTGITYDNSTGTFALANIPNSSLVNTTIEINGTTVTLGGSNSFGTDSVSEESNLYYTDARSRNAISLTTNKSSVLDYNSTTGVFTFNLANQTTDDVAEGTTNLYFTTQRARDSVSAIDAGGDGSFSYDSTTGAFTYTGPSDSEVRAHFGASTSGTGYGGLSYNSGTGVYTYAKVTSADIRGQVSATKSGGDGNFSYDEPTGVFTYTGPDQDNYRLAISATKVSGDGNLTYDDSTGIISYTGPSDAEARAHFSATSNTGITYNSSTGVFALANIPNSSLTNNSVTVNGATVALGASTTFSTDATSEGLTNLYYLDSRARNAISLTTSDSGVFSYDPATGVFVYDNTGLNTDEVAEGSTNLYFTQARARQSISATGWSNLSYDNTTGVINISAPSTADVSEDASNLYFTNVRARSAVSLITDNTDALSYDNTTGVFHFTLNSVTTDEIAEGSTNYYFTTARARNSVNNGANIDYDPATGTISTQAAVWSVNGQTHDVVLDTDDINEGSTNLYFTDARAQNALTLVTDDANILSYATGTLTFVTPTTDAIDEGMNNLYYTDGRADGRIAVASIRDLGDVNKTEALQDGYTLVWSSALGEFVPQNVAVTATTLNFTGDGTTTSFSAGVEVTSIDNTQVYINGLIQAPTYSYTISTTNHITSIVFDTAPEANDYIFVRVSSTSTLTAGGVLNESSNIDGGTY
jgi:antitoxin component YwqK of YwqJK toxin-antitoxin module